jgi:hypothetical protein
MGRYLEKYGSINDKGEWQIRYNHELYQLFDKPHIIKVIKRRLRWLGHLLRTEES